MLDILLKQKKYASLFPLMVSIGDNLSDTSQQNTSDSCASKARGILTPDTNTEPGGAREGGVKGRGEIQKRIISECSCTKMF